MKRIVFIIMFIALTVSALAQNNFNFLEYHKILDNGEKVSIKTKTALIREKGQPEIGISLMYETAMKENPEMSGYSLFVTFLSYRDDWVFPLDGKLLMRTTSGKVISLQQTLSNRITLYDPETGYENNTYHLSASDHYDQSRGSIVYRKVGKYPIIDEDLRSIIEEGIIKVRLETTGDSVECQYPAAEELKVNRKKETHNIASFALLPYYNALLENVDPYTTF